MRVIIDEIARISGVSKATVSRVLNNKQKGVSNETRLRVQAILNDLNYNNNGRLSNNYSWKTRSIALIVPDITNMFFSEITKVIEGRAREDNYSVILGNTNFSEEDETKCILSVVAKKVDGIILVSAGATCKDEHYMPEKFKIPCLLLDRNLDGMKHCSSVFSDNEQAIIDSFQLLVKNGNRQIAFISGPSHVSTAKERLGGYIKALQQNGILYDPDLIKFGNYTVESGYNAVIELERAGINYSAVIATNDMMAIGAMKAINELARKIPKDIEVIGFDNISIAQYCDPPLTTIQQPTIEMGRKATEILLDVINGKQTEQKNIRLKPRLLIRKTTK